MPKDPTDWLNAHAGVDNDDPTRVVVRVDFDSAVHLTPALRLTGLSLHVSRDGAILLGSVYLHEIDTLHSVSPEYPVALG